MDLIVSSRYRIIDYIESTGEQWIDTGLPNTGDYIIEDNFLLTYINVLPGDGSWIIGGRKESNHGFGFFMAPAFVVALYGAASQSYRYTSKTFTWYDLYFSRLKCTISDGVNTNNIPVSGGVLIPDVTEYKTNILLGKNQLNYAGTGDDTRNMWGYRKSTKITDANTGEILRDYVPAIDELTNMVGMLDRANVVFYPSAGPSEFIAGFEPVDRTKLLTTLAYGDLITEEKYTEQTYNIFKTYYDIASTIYTTDLVTQNEIDVAASDLLNAIVSLTQINEILADYDVEDIELYGFNYIDTNIKLFDSDKDFTIIMKYVIDVGTFGTEGQKTLLHCMYDESPNYNGFVIQSDIINVGIPNAYKLDYNTTNKTQYDVVALNADNILNEYTIVIKKDSINSILTIDTFDENNIQIDNITTETNPYIDGEYQNTTLILGAANILGTIDRYSIGTIYDFEYYDSNYLDTEDSTLKALKISNNLNTTNPISFSSVWESPSEWFINNIQLYDVSGNITTDFTLATQYSLLNNTITINDSAFENCDVLTSFVIDKTITSIGNRAFYGCTQLTNITITDLVSSIGDKAFINCNSLNSINVMDANNYYADNFGVLYNKDKTILIQYPAKNSNNSFIIPNTVTTINYGVFYNCINLVNITFPSSVTNIGTDVFFGCINLKNINAEPYTVEDANIIRNLLISTNPQQISLVMPQDSGNVYKILSYNNFVTNFYSYGVQAKALYYYGTKIWELDSTPDAYILDYIESDGNQYIRTGIQTANNIIYKSNIMFLDNQSDTYPAVIGARIRQSNSDFSIMRNAANIGQQGITNWYNNGGISEGVCDLNVWYDIESRSNNGNFYVDNNLLGSNYSFIVVPLEIISFGRNDNGTITRLSKMRKKYETISRNSENILNMLPCEMLDGTICMYDTVSKEYKTNDGSGTFVGGNRIGYVKNGNVIYY